MATTELVPDRAKTEGVTAHVIWMTAGLSCDGGAVAAGPAERELPAGEAYDDDAYEEAG